MMRRLNERDARLVVIGAAVVAAALLYALRARGPVRAQSRAGIVLLCERIEAPPRAWEAIVIHHSATAGGSAASIDRFHRGPERGWRSLGYHFVIGNGRGATDGGIEVGPRWRRQEPGAHAGPEMNRVAIGICLIGDFQSQDPTPAQMTSLPLLVRYLMARYHITPGRVLLHRDVAQTLCPGARFPAAALREQLR